MKTEYQKQKQRNKRKLKSEKMVMVWEKETETLETFMYENGLENNTQQFSPYHFRIKTDKVTIDIWAGAKKFYIKGMGGSTRYNDINELKEYL